MKKHGRYRVAFINDIKYGLMNGENDYVNNEIQRMKHKYKNTKRHKEKLKSWKEKTRMSTKKWDDGTFR